MDIATQTRAEGPTAITDAKKRYRAGVLNNGVFCSRI